MSGPVGPVRHGDHMQHVTFDEVVDHITARVTIPRALIADRMNTGWTYQQRHPGGDTWITPAGDEIPAESPLYGLGGNL